MSIMGIMECIGEGVELLALGADSIRREVSYKVSVVATDVRTKAKCGQLIMQQIMNVGWNRYQTQSFGRNRMKDAYVYIENVA